MLIMRIANRTTLIILFVSTLLLFPAVTFTSGVLRIVLVLPLVLFIPGYTLLSAIFPKRGSLSGVERIAFSFGLSIAITILIGIILNYTPWGIKPYPILISTTILIVIIMFIAWYKSPPFGEGLSVYLNINLPKWTKMADLDKALYIFLVAAILLTLGTVSYVIAVPKQEQRFTEFYILSVDNRAENYPREVILGEPVELIIGIVNHDDEVFTYSVVVRIDSTVNKRIVTSSLDNEGSWEEVVSFIPRTLGPEQKVEFWLYKNGEDEPFLDDPLHFYLDVINP